MKKISFRFLTYEELCNLNIHSFNRCGHITLDEAQAHGTSEHDYNTFIKRCERTLKDIKKNGYLETSVLIIAKCKEDGKIYLIEGQGRRGAIILGVNQGKLNVETHSLNTIPCFMYDDELSYEDIGKKIEEHNIKKSSPWKTNDLTQIHVKIEGGDVEEAYNMVKKYREKNFKRDGVYTCNLLFYAGKVSHLRGKDIKLTKNDFRENYEIFTSLYEKFLNEFATTKPIKDNERYSYVRRCDFSIIWESFFNYIHKICRQYNYDAHSIMSEVLDYIIKWSNSNTTTVQNIKEFLSISKESNGKFTFLDKINVNKMANKIFSDNIAEVLPKLQGWPFASETSRTSKKVA